MAPKKKDKTEEVYEKSFFDKFGYHSAVKRRGLLYEFFELIPARRITPGGDEASQAIKENMQALLKIYKDRYPSRNLIMLSPPESLHRMTIGQENRVGAILYREVSGLFTMFNNKEVLDLDNRE